MALNMSDIVCIPKHGPDEVTIVVMDEDGYHAAVRVPRERLARFPADTTSEALYQARQHIEKMRREDGQG